MGLLFAYNGERNDAPHYPKETVGLAKYQLDLVAYRPWPRGCGQLEEDKHENSRGSHARNRCLYKSIRSIVSRVYHAIECSEKGNRKSDENGDKQCVRRGGYYFAEKSGLRHKGRDGNGEEKPD